jgi:outer membrane protein OmpA-like peptidoglycan-associated protein
MRKVLVVTTYFLLLTTYIAQAQVQWASKVIDFSSEYKDDLIRNNSTRWSATQVLGYPNSIKFGSSQLAWTPQKQDGSSEYITVGFDIPQTVQQVIIGENYNAGSVSEIILYDNKGKKYSVFENSHPVPVQKLYDVLTYFKIKPTYNVVKLKLIINTNTTFGREEIDCIGISSNVLPYKQNINVVKYSEPVGKPENLGSNVNSEYYDHLPLISPDGSLLYFTRKLTDESKSRAFNDDIYVSQVLPTGKFSKAENIGPPLNTADNNFACFISSDNNRLYVANKYIKNTYNFDGLSVSNKQKDGSWSKPKPLDIPDIYNKNEFAHYCMNLEENVVLMALQRDDSYGDLDLYVSKKYSDGSWTKPKNLGSTINTIGAEGSVFLAADGKTLYFSSTGHPGFGSYDMFMSKRLDDTWTNWSKPLNLGDKINTDEMDIYYTIPAAGDYAYFSSGLTMFGNNDLYRIKLPKEARPEFVDIKKIIASTPKKNEMPATTTVNTTLSPQKPILPPPTTIPPPVTSTTIPRTNSSPQTDELQKKLDDLKKQQTQVVTPPAKPIPTPTPTSPVVISTSISTTTAPRTEIKRDVVNSIQPYQSPEELKTKPTLVNSVQPVETPKPAPKILTQEELAAREQQKINPTIRPSEDNLNTLSKHSMPTPAPIANNVGIPSAQRISNPNIVTTEVDPNTVEPSRTSNNITLKTTTPAVDDYQKKLDELKRQQANQPMQQPIANNSAPITSRTIAEQYPNPSPVIATTNAKTDELQQKLEALKQQQVGQDTKLNNYYYTPKPYDPQPLKERQEDVASKEYDDYQKKLEDLKKQQKNVTVVTPSPTVITTSPSPTVETPKNISKKQEPASKSATIQSTASGTNPIISKYEEKLRKLQEEMAALKTTTSAIETPLPQQDTPTASIVQKTPFITPTSPILSETKLTESNTASPPKAETIIIKNDLPEHADTSNTIPVFPIISTSQNIEREQQKLDSIQQVQKKAEQTLTASLDKMENNKQTLEKDIADLQDQRQKFSKEKDKLTVQNTKLSDEKSKLEAEKKQMDDLLTQMQMERDKLATEKKKMEEDKEKLEALKKQQEKEVFALKRSIDSLGKIQLRTAATVQQNSDIFNVPLQVGAVAPVNNVYFVADAAFLQIPSYPELDKVALFLSRNKNLRVEIGGHTNGLCDDAFCQKLSTNRAKTCVDYLISKGISANRLSYKGYGKTQLLKPNELGNPLNQRVEIKIISMD